MDHNSKSLINIPNGVSTTNCTDQISPITIYPTEIQQVNISIDNASMIQSPEICTKDIKSSPVTPDDVVDSYKGLVTEFKGCIAIN